MIKNLLRSQEQLLRSTENVVIYGGERGCGNTTAALLKFTKVSSDPNTRCVILCNSFISCRDKFTQVKELLKEFILKEYKRDLTLILKSGAELRISKVSSYEDALCHGGSLYSLIIFDDIESIEKNVLEFMLTKLISYRTEYPPQMLLTVGSLGQMCYLFNTLSNYAGLTVKVIPANRENNKFIPKLVSEMYARCLNG